MKPIIAATWYCHSGTLRKSVHGVCGNEKIALILNMRYIMYIRIRTNDAEKNAANDDPLDPTLPVVDICDGTVPHLRE